MANEKKNSKNPLMTKGTGKSLAEMVAEVTNDSVDEQTGSGTRTVNGFKVFKENLQGQDKHSHPFNGCSYDHGLYRGASQRTEQFVIVA